MLMKRAMDNAGYNLPYAFENAILVFLRGPFEDTLWTGNYCLSLALSVWKVSSLTFPGT